MKSFILPLACLAAFAATASAAINVPGADGSDGPLNVTANTVIDLGLAPAGVWDADNSANAGDGIYDPAKWAVVFKYSSVNVAAGATLTFKNNASRAPVVWLVSGNVTIAGTVSLNGQNWAETPNLAEPGPGGFRGGVKAYSGEVSNGAGFGMGGGARVSGTAANLFGAGGSYGSLGSGGNSVHGNPSLIPLIGGSGGGGAYNTASNPLSVPGGAGGGAMLLACSGNVTISGQITANGGFSQDFIFIHGGSGSGGGIRIVANQFSGNGIVQSIGGASNVPGGNGRIRIERVTNSATITPTPDPSVVDLQPGATALIWPPSTGPEVKIISVGGTDAPADPKAGFGTIGADVALPAASSTTVVVETTNVEAESTVLIRVTPRSGANYTEYDAGEPITMTTSPLVLRWTASLPVGTGYNAVQARVIRP